MIKTYKDIQGWFDTPILYASLIENCYFDREMNILEVGTWLGKSTCYLAGHIKAWAKPITIWAVDTFEGDPTCEFQQEVVKKNNGSILSLFNQNIHDLGLQDYIKPIVSTSQTCLDKLPEIKFDIIIIDAAHDYNSVKNDINYLWPALKEGGIMMGHDFEKDVEKAVKEFCDNHCLRAVVSGIVWMIQKPKK